MTEHGTAAEPRRWRHPMAPRDRGEEHRASTPLELLFDLCFVVAVAAAAAGLHHDLAEGHVGHAIASYLSVFFAIWWAWMNFTWFASAYDTDDVPYRLLTLLQIAGGLVLAAGVPAAFERFDFTTITIGYVLMRVAMVGQWLRAAAEHPEGRRTALRFAAGVGACQVGWVLRLALPDPWGQVGFVVMVAAEVAVPIWAERHGRGTSWHPGHITERYGLFTIIVLGEVVLAATAAIRAAVDTHGLSPSLLAVSAGGLILVFGLWWSYFKRPAAAGLAVTSWLSFLWGYGHYVVFASAAALGAGLEVVTQTTEGDTELGPAPAAFTVAVPVALFLLALGFLQNRIDPSLRIAVRFAVVAGLVLVAAALATIVPLALTVVLMGLLVSALIVADIATAQRRLAAGRAPEPTSS